MTAERHLLPPATALEGNASWGRGQGQTEGNTVTFTSTISVVEEPARSEGRRGAARAPTPNHQLGGGGRVGGGDRETLEGLL